jgi:hypothetical protein
MPSVPSSRAVSSRITLQDRTIFNKAHSHTIAHNTLLYCLFSQEEEEEEVLYKNEDALIIAHNFKGYDQSLCTHARYSSFTRHIL